jgi:hypothetical protein
MRNAMMRVTLAGLGGVLIAAAAGCAGGETPASRPAGAGPPAAAPAPTTAPAAFDEAKWRRKMTTACAAEVTRQRARLPSGFLAAAEPPFVVVSNLSQREMDYYRRHTIRAAMRALWATYFRKRPTKVTKIYLFRDAATYRHYAAAWFNDRQVPHFGYFRRAEGVMVMNIRTGGGTLVHEMVHALVAPDFPDLPDWFNEGLASLYEQCNIRGDTISGLVNWRLPALQKAVREKKLRPLRELMTADDFYRNQTGLNYAQARYLCQYLQHKRKLVAYYKAFRDGHKNDKWGVATLERITGRKLEALEEDYLKWVMTLRR